MPAHADKSINLQWPSSALRRHDGASRGVVSCVSLAFLSLVNSRMLAVLAWRSQRPLPGQQVVLALWALGVLAFAGSLYLMALAGLSVGIVTPIGGLLLMAGWLALGVTALLSRS